MQSIKPTLATIKIEKENIFFNILVGCHANSFVEKIIHRKNSISRGE